MPRDLLHRIPGPADDKGVAREEVRERPASCTNRVFGAGSAAAPSH
ncbi:hypothetical protein ACWCPF_38520 [Streptomyces sp. NPDC001858]